MKTKYIIVLGFLIVLLSVTTVEVEETNCDDIQNPTKNKDCNGKLSTSDKNKEFKYCCYVDRDGGKWWEGITQDMYYKIQENEKYYKENNIIIECFSSYLALGFLLLISLVSFL